MREEFEKLPEIAKKIEYDDVWWSEKYNSYRGSDFELDCYANGAWYAYQEQQKKIDKAIEYLDSIEGLVWYEQIKDILK